MNSPKVSVIIPAYNQGRYVAEAVQSVLTQTYTDWELIVVDDGSTDSTAGEVARFNDARLQYVYQTNQGVSEARNVAIATSSGEYLTFLDADDIYHPGKLEAQVAHLEQNPEIGLTYVSRIDIDQDGNRLRFHRPPLETSLKELVLGFPFGPTDFMVRHDWVTRVGNFSKSFVINEDRHFFLRLALAGCRFAGVDQFLAYHRYYAGRIVPDLPAKLDDMLRALDTVFSDPRCPAEVLPLHNLAHRNIYFEWAYQAAVKDETSLAQACFREALRFDPSILAGKPDELLQRLVEAATRDGGEHEGRLRKVFAQFPPELGGLSGYCNWAVACGYLQRGVRDTMWNRTEMGHAHLTKAAALGAQLDERSLRLLRYQLLNYDAGFGPEVIHTVLRQLSPYLEKIGGRTGVRRLNEWYSVNRAFRDYREGAYVRVLQEVARAVVNNPKHLGNRELRAILSSSLAALWRKCSLRKGACQIPPAL